ncbi:hypothetical protein L915_17818 [Phytophthora nicotianae]|uniref:Uncharacterized protein n=1 Tax=Phytophthora nicotianae TaxID=4792 RepID=W2FZY2_PHYNI|nr:hypothetical protein L915_17818 [Phytophthora nicotianae]ETL29038.1 hypothetical protein L916_17718 [Phytophthora nicotianae]
MYYSHCTLAYFAALVARKDPARVDCMFFFRNLLRPTRSPLTELRYAPVVKAPL